MTTKIKRIAKLLNQRGIKGFGEDAGALERQDVDTLLRVLEEHLVDEDESIDLTTPVESSSSGRETILDHHNRVMNLLKYGTTDVVEAEAVVREDGDDDEESPE